MHSKGCRCTCQMALSSRDEMRMRRQSQDRARREVDVSGTKNEASTVLSPAPDTNTGGNYSRKHATYHRRCSDKSQQSYCCKQTVNKTHSSFRNQCIERNARLHLHQRCASHDCGSVSTMRQPRFIKLWESQDVSLESPDSRMKRGTL